MQPNEQQPTTSDITPEVTTSTDPVNTTPASSMPPVVGVAPTLNQEPSSPAKKGLSKKVKLLLIGVAAIVVLAGSSAGAYYGVIVPNKPENLLKTGIANTLKQKQFSYEATVDAQAVDSSKAGAMPATNVVIKGANDLDKGTFKAEVTATVSGFKVTGEVRYVEENGYIRLGDLSTLKNLASSYSPEAANALDKIQNQWIEVDKTLIKQAKADCALNTKLVFSDADLKQLGDAYDKTPFTTIKSKTADKVNGNAATKLELTIDDNKLGDYAKNFDNLSFVKQLKSCSKEVSDKANYSSLKDGDTTPLTIWVDKGTKRIVKIAGKTTDQDAKKDNVKGTVSVVLSYGAVTIDKPQGAKPVVQLISEFAPLFQSNVRGANSDNPFSLLGL